ncbi:pentatricopeptide repeat-containing protein At5g66520-like [Asparagus officinalis]|nr:pentatricopeptide repeat-containing protein At5g66520-like [Asparagus officinalis]
MACAYSTSNQPSDSLRLIQSAMYSGFALNLDALTITFSTCCKLGRLNTFMEVHVFVIKGGYEIDLFVSTELIGVYGDKCELSLAHRLFNKIPVRNVVAWNVIVQQYIKHGFHEKAEELFGDMMDMHVVSWNTMISGFCRAGLYAKAVALFHEMKLSKMKPNEVTMRIVLSACSELGALDMGIWVSMCTYLAEMFLQ